MTADYWFTAVNPEEPDGEPTQLRLPGNIIDQVFKTNPVKYENLRAAKHVLDHTERIFAGIRRFQDGGWCYTGRPEEWYVAENVVAPFPDNLVFAVYVRPRRIVYGWLAEKCDPDNPSCPIGWETRYRRLIWTGTSSRT